MNDLIRVVNDGQRLVETNYWGTPNAREGYLYMSINAGAYRLLVPSSRHAWIADMRTARELVITRGRWKEAKLSDAFELLFDDHTDNPFVIQMVPQQWDRLPESDNDLGWKGVFRAYAEQSPDPVVALERVYYRLADIPCLQQAPVDNRSQSE